MAGSYLALVGGEKIVSVLDASAAAMNPGTINGVLGLGRKGTQKIQALIALAGASTTAIPLTTAAALFSLVVQSPFPTPAANGDDGFNYAALLPEVRAQVVCSGFVPTVSAWPVDMTALLAAMATAPANVPVVSGRLTAVAAPTPDGTPAYPNGTLTYNFSGAQTVATVANALVLVTIDFGASSAN